MAENDKSMVLLAEAAEAVRLARRTMQEEIDRVKIRLGEVSARLREERERREALLDELAAARTRVAELESVAPRGAGVLLELRRLVAELGGEAPAPLDLRDVGQRGLVVGGRVVLDPADGAPGVLSHLRGRLGVVSQVGKEYVEVDIDGDAVRWVKPCHLRRVPS